MAEKRYHPLVEFSRIEDAFDRYVDRFFSGLFPSRWRREWPLEVEWSPVVDLIDKKNHFLLRADLPGLKKEDVKISISEDNVMTISGETKRSEEESKEDYYRRERVYGAFSRSLQLPSNVITEKVEATLNDGILEVKLPRKEERKVTERRIEVK